MSHPLLNLRPLKMLMLLSLVVVSVLPAWGRGPDLSKYPLRIQVLVASAHDWTPQDPFAGGGMPQMEGVEAPSMMGSGPPLAVFSTPVYYGEGWGDIVSSETPQAVKFTYMNCQNRIPSTLATEPLPARWTEDGKGHAMEVLVPVETAPSAVRSGKAAVKKYSRCEIPVKVYDYVYLLLRNGSIVKVSREAYAEKPQLHKLLENGDPVLREHSEGAQPVGGAPRDASQVLPKS